MMTTKADDLELLPCPFCGGDAEMDTRQGYLALGTGRLGNRIAVYCRQCDADMGVCIEDVPDITPEQVAEMWNRRAAVEADRANLAGAIHYPDCWDTTAYPTLSDALREMSGTFRCSECQPAASAEPECWCETCRPIALDDMRMVLCPICGNKRCPHATDHRNACTGSNEPGQPGSSYGPRAASVAQEPVDFEHRHAIKQGERNGAEDKYFEARPEFDNKQDRRLFCDGFDRGYEAAPVAAQPSVPDGVKSTEILAGLFRNLNGVDKNHPGYHHASGWNDAIRRAMDVLLANSAPNPTPPAVEPRLCPKCGADRSKVPCPGDLMNCPIRGEAQATVERPISDVLSDVVTQGIGIMRIDPTDIYQSTPPAVEQPSAQGREDTERLYAIKEGVRNAACDNHFASRGHLDCNIQAAVFNAGFDRGWDAAIDAARKEQP